MIRNYNIAGFGGQGILYLGQCLAFAGMLSGKHSTWIPSYGPEMRGGTANCMVVISSDLIRSPLVYSSDVAIILNQPSLEKYGPGVKTGGALLYVSELACPKNPLNGVNLWPIPAKAMAEELKLPMSMNMIMLGALLTIDPILSVNEAEEAIKEITPAHRSQLIEMNIRALQAGREYIEKENLAALQPARGRGGG